MVNLTKSEITAIETRCRFELSTNFECPSARILGVYGAKLGLSGQQMFDRLAEGL
jgi:hypothetical protein